MNKKDECVDSVESNLWVVIGFLCFLIIIGFLNDLLRDVFRIIYIEIQKFIKKDKN